MTDQETVLRELRQIIMMGQEYTTWTVSTPHILALYKSAYKKGMEDAPTCARNCHPKERETADSGSDTKRAWQGLTKDEVELLSYKADGNTWTAVELAEAKLKEKNTPK